MRVTLCCVAFNEEHRIARFIEYHKPHFDEIVILNQGSTDNTHAIANSLGVKVVYCKCLGLAEPARHACALNASNDWILFLDADEEASEGLLKEIPNLISGQETGYLLGRRNYENGEFKYDESNQYRLFHKNHVFFQNVLHGGIEPFGCCNTGFFPNGINHYKTTEESSIDHSAYSRIIHLTPEGVNPFWYLQYKAQVFPLQELMSLVVTTSAKHSNPSIQHIIELFDAFNDKFGLQLVRKILVVDGFNSQRNTNNIEYDKLGLMDENKFNEYKSNLRTFCSSRGIFMLELGRNVYMDAALVEGTKMVSTPYYMFSPDDIKPVQSVDISDVIKKMCSYLPIKRLHFHNYELQTNNHDHTLIQDTSAPFPAVKTSTWSGNTHIGYTHHMNYVWCQRVQQLNRYPLELVIHKEYNEMQQKFGFDYAHKFYGCYLYGNIGDLRYVDHDFSYMEEIGKLNV